MLLNKTFIFRLLKNLTDFKLTTKNKNGYFPPNFIGNWLLLVEGKVADFCLLIMYLDDLPDSFSSKKF